MNFPFTAFTELGVDATLLISLVVGMGFGFMLEKGGFGSSKVLAGIFYGKDWRVLKVMFTAIVTAMLGLYAAQGLGFVAMDQIAFRPTFLGGQIVGGLMLGIGFVTAGYCPGTSMVGLVSGKLDALVVMLGILLGIGVFEEGFEYFVGLRDWGDMGRVSLSEWMGIPNGYVVLMVVAMALGAFAAVGYGERHFAAKRHAVQKGTDASNAAQQTADHRDDAAPPATETYVEVVAQKPQPAIPRRAWAGVGTAAFAGILVAGIQFAGPGDARAMNSEISNEAATLVNLEPTITPEELASMFVEGRTDFLLIDLRGGIAQVELPGAWKTDVTTLNDARLRPDLPADRRIILTDSNDLGSARRVAASLRSLGLNAIVLQGGTRAWENQIVDPAADSLAARVYRMMLTGKSPLAEGAAPPPPRKKGAAPPAKKKKRGGGCS